MIVDKNDNVEIQAQGFGRTEKMSIDEGSLQHILGVLTNLYSDPELAVIREYSTNAYDSHVEAGKGNVPIQVHLPDVFEPMFKVKDYGVGLSEEEVYTIFGRYGASTKRESNDFVGQLGLGCKSALTLANQFTLIAIKNGEKNTFNIHVDETGIPTISKAHGMLTDESNGVEIIVPVKDAVSFTRKAQDFYRFFPVTPVDYENNAVKITELDIAMDFGDKIYLVNNVSANYVVMGGVPYRADELFPGHFYGRGGRVVVYADMGDVSFTPSREELHYTRKTRDFLEKIEKKVEARLVEQVENKIKGCDTFLEAVNLVSNLEYSFTQFFKHVAGTSVSEKVKYKGLEIDPLFNKEMLYYNFNGEQFNKREIRSIGHLRRASEHIIVQGNASELSSTYKARIKIFYAQQKIPTIIYISKNVPLSTYHHRFDVIFKGMKRLDCEKDLKSIKLPTATKKGSIKDAYFPRVSVAGWKLDFNNEKVDTSRTIVRGTRKQFRHVFNQSRETFNELLSKFTLYSVTESQKKSFTQAFNAISIESAFTKMLDDINASLTDEQIMNSMGIRSNLDMRLVRHFKKDEIKDAELKRLIAFLNDRSAPASIDSGTLRSMSRMSHLSHHPVWQRIENVKEKLSDEHQKLEAVVLERYPYLAQFPDASKIVEYTLKKEGA